MTPHDTNADTKCVGHTEMLAASVSNTRRSVSNTHGIVSNGNEGAVCDVGASAVPPGFKEHLMSCVGTHTNADTKGAGRTPMPTRRVSDT